MVSPGIFANFAVPQNLEKFPDLQTYFKIKAAATGRLARVHTGVVTAGCYNCCTHPFQILSTYVPEQVSVVLFYLTFVNTLAPFSQKFLMGFSLDTPYECTFQIRSA